jgi:hypothetical protein
MVNIYKKPVKIVVFDLDETLGSFVEIAMFWDALENYVGNSLINNKFNEVMELFQEFLRPDILTILSYLKTKKINKSCDKIMIYTNNQGPKSWVKMISNYLNLKLNYDIFDQIIAAFKVKGQVIEVGRTSHDKSVDDLVRCTKIPENTEICFLDDQYHPLMEHDNVYYINVKPYSYSLPFNTMANRFYDYEINNTNSIFKEEEKKEKFIDSIVKYMSLFHYNVFIKKQEEIEVDKIISKKIVLHLEDFFKQGQHSITLKKIKVKKGKNKSKKRKK